MRVVAFGLGRSGLSVARAEANRGRRATVVDQSPEAALAKPELAAEARALRADLRLGWDGSFTGVLNPGDTLVVNPAVRAEHPALAEARALGAEVVSEIEYAYRISAAPLVAVTGTNGKSTTAVMTTLALRGAGVDAVLCGNVFGSGYEERSLAEAADVATPDQILVAEVSSFQLEQTVDFRPVSAAITNITEDHLDRHGSMAVYAEIKHRIFRCQGEGDFAVVRANDPVVVPPGRSAGGYVPRALRRPSGGEAPKGLPRVLTFGATSDDARVEETELSLFEAKIPWSRLPTVRTPHDRQNAAAALMLAYGALVATGHPSVAAALAARRQPPKSVYGPRRPDPTDAVPPALLDGLAAFRGLAHRMEEVGERDGVRVVNNSMCTNPDAVLRSLQALRDPCHVLMGGVDKDLDFVPLGRYLANGRHRVYLFGRDAERLREEMSLDAPVFGTMAEAFAAATRAARRPDVIVLAPGCASSDQFRDFRDRGNVFRDLAKEWLDS